MGNLSLTMVKSLLVCAALVAAQGLPSANVNVAPLFNGSDVQFLNVTLRISDVLVKANTAFLTLSGDRYGADNPLMATDDQGALPIAASISTADGSRSWSISRDSVGEIKVSFIADPHANVSGVGGRGDLRYDQGGIFGMGQAFIPYPPADEKWNMSVSWEIPDSAIDGTRFTSSMNGEEIQGASITGVPAKTLAKTVFAAGPNLQRWPSWDTEIKVSSGHEFAVYWMGELPWDSTEISSLVKDVYNGTANYFNDYDSPFRVFIRHDFEAYGGIGSFQAFLLEYHDGSEQSNPVDALICLLSHEIIHNYALLWPDNSNGNNWYTEGIAEYLGINSPFLSGAINRTHWIRWMNDEAQDYYTGSPVGRTWDVVVANYWNLGTANVKTAYTRGFIYLAYVQGLIHDATSGTRSIDDVILPMYNLYKDGQTVGREEFLQLLGNIITREAADASFEKMSSGEIIVPSPTAYAKWGLTMVRQDAPKFSLGMSESSLGEGQVIGLVPGSRAEQAGLKEDDQIISYWSMWDLMDTLDSRQHMVVMRDGQELRFEYWPRSVDTIVENWQWVDAPQV